MIKQKDMEILSHLRQDARKKVTEIAKKLDMPATTIYDRLKLHKRKGFVKKHVALLDFSKLGYHAPALVALKVDNDKREPLRKYLLDHPNLNSLYRINFGYDFLVEVIFENIPKLHEFMDEIQTRFDISSPKIFSIIDEIRKEEFLSK